MKKQKFSWQKLPAKFRAVFNIICILLCILTIYFLLGSPPFSVKDAFRRAEKANFVGPAKILAHIETENMPYSHLILAETESDVTVFSFDPEKDEVCELIYAEKVNGMALVAAPEMEDLAIAKSANVPIILFHSNPYAMRAEIALRLSGTYKGESYAKTYELAAVQKFDNCFIFHVSVSYATPLLEEGYLLNMLQCVHSSPRPALAGVSINADVTLYNGNDTVIETQKLILCEK